MYIFKPSDPVNLLKYVTEFNKRYTTDAICIYKNTLYKQEMKINFDRNEYKTMICKQL